MSPKPKLSDKQIATAAKQLQDNPSLTQSAVAQKLGIDKANLSRALARHKKPSLPPGLTLSNIIVEIPHSALFPSPNNPRKTFQDETLEELANSIARNGLLQNLVAKPADSAGRYEITDGERRWRAVGLLIARNQHAELLPVRIIDADSATHQALSLLANLQRENVPPLEEADGIAALHAMNPEIWTAAEIAASIGRGVRYVQHRIAMSKNLVEPAKILLRDGYITIESARLLAAEPHATQLAVLAQFECDELTTETDFSEYDGDCNITAKEITSALQFIRAESDRAKAAAARAAMPEPPKQMRLDSPSQADRDADDEPAEQQPSAPPPKINDEATGEPYTNSHLYHAHRRKSQAMQRAVANSHTIAMRLVIMALLGPQSVVFIEEKSAFYEDHIYADEQIENVIKSHLGGLEPPAYMGETKQELALWQHLCALQILPLTELFAATVACNIYTPAGIKTLVGDTPLAEAVAKTLGIEGFEADHGLTITDKKDLAGLRADFLRAVAQATHTAGINSASSKDEVTDAILHRLLDHDYVLPTFRFGSTKWIETAIKVMTSK